MLNMLRNMKPGEAVELSCTKTGEFRVVGYTEKASKGHNFKYGDVAENKDAVVVRMFEMIEEARDIEAAMGPIDKEPFAEFYIMPIVDKVRELCESIWHRVTGAWYCDYCKKYHGRRVKHHKAVNMFVNADICSRGVKALKDKTWEPENLFSKLLVNLFGEAKCNCDEHCKEASK